MTENTKLWDILGRTDPSHVKKFKRAGGFEGTAIKPMWSYRRMTEEFGPCGTGWGVGAPQFQVVPGPEGEVLVYCTASIWYGAEKAVVFGVGGDKVVGKNKYGLATDDEAFKKAFTDAVTNALKLIGVGADVHMGMFDDNKYVNTMKEEFSEPKPKSSAQLKRDDFWGKFQEDVYGTQGLVELDAVRTEWRKKAIADGWTAAWKEAAKDVFAAQEKAIIDAMGPAEQAGVPLDRALKASLAQHPLNAG